MQNDQADALRKKAESKESISGSSFLENEQRKTEVVAIVSGKGGVGKSNFVVNFSILLEERKKKVLIIDLDIGMANIDILIGEISKSSIVDMLNHEKSIWSVIETGPGGLSYIAGGSGLAEIFKMSTDKLQFFHRQLESIEGYFDYIFLDMGAGVSESSFDFLFASHRLMLVTTPEPTSVTDAYAMIKFVHTKDESIPISVIVNRVHSERDGKSTFENIHKVAFQFLQKKVSLIGLIPEDETVWKAVRAQKPFVIQSPKSTVAKAVRNAVLVFVSEKEYEKTPETSIKSFLNKLKGFLRASN